MNQDGKCTTNSRYSETEFGCWSLRLQERVMHREKAIFMSCGEGMKYVGVERNLGGRFEESGRKVHQLIGRMLDLRRASWRTTKTQRAVVLSNLDRVF
jgi:hypothetical protein